jgi:hypothetical protein
MKTTDPSLEISGDKIDGGELVGRRPSDVPSEVLSLNFSAQNPMKAIRAKCLDCCCGNAAEVRKCVATDCALWPFRLASNPFRKRSVLSEDEKQRRTAQLKRLDSGDQPSHIGETR